MAEDSLLKIPGIDDIPEIKTEPIDPLLVETQLIPKNEHLSQNGISDDPDCEEVLYFTEAEVNSTRKCLENTKLIIKDFETQLDWHLQQYMTLLKKRDETNKKQDFLTISMLSSIIANHPEGNKKFIKRKNSISNGKQHDESEDSDFSEDFDSDDSGRMKHKNNHLTDPSTSIAIPQIKMETIKEEKISGDEKLGQTSQSVHQSSSFVEIKDEELDRDEWIDVLLNKSINALEELFVDFNKPIVILKSDNVHKFDFSDCLTSNVIITYDSNDMLPEFVFTKNVSTYILNDFIKLVQTDVFDHYLSEQVN